MASVIVKRKRPPVFPDVCVVCGQSVPGGFVRIKAAFTERRAGVLSVIAGEWGVDVPACGPCARQVHLQNRSRFLLALLCVCVGTVVAAGVVPVWAGWWRITAMTSVILASLLPYFAYERLNPRPVSLSVEGLHARFTFRDPFYAAEFVQLNGEESPDAERVAGPDRPHE